MSPREALAACTFAFLAGCLDPGAETTRDDTGFSPVYNGIETRLLDPTLVNFIVEMQGARGNEDVSDYAQCAAAQYAMIRGFGFARHVRTRVVEEAGVWRADAVYTISPALPEGVQTINAEITVQVCEARGIPTV